MAFDPVDSCIYCGRLSDLTDEHIVPFALGGRLILPKSSCRACAKVTSAFERECLRGFMLDARTAGGYPTRRPRKRPTTLPLEVTSEGEQELLRLEPSDHPGFLFLPRFERAGILAGGEPRSGLLVNGVETLYFGKAPPAVASELDAEGLRYSAQLPAYAFARLIAKIAYSYAVGARGLLPLSHATVLPLILRGQNDASQWVGSSDFRLEVESKGPLHALSSGWIPDPSGSSRGLLLVRVKLFASSGASGYEVVVHQERAFS